MTTTDLILPFAMNNASDNMLVVLEDDVIIPADIDLSFRMALKQVPSNWDILFLGCFQNAMVGSGGVVRGPFYPRNLSIDEGFKNNLCSSESLIEIPGTPWKGVLSCTTGTWAYALRKNSADKISGLLNQMKPFHEPIDVMYRNMFENRKINVYCLNPELIRPNYALPSFLR
jgi:GR25 family glycosyltransferase involved in LPS biosynthesis